MKFKKNILTIALSTLFFSSMAFASNPASTTYVDNAIAASTVTAGDGLTKTNNTLSLNPFYHVGDIAQNGIVYFVDQTGQHGLLMALQDADNTYPWWPANINGVSARPQSTGAVTYGLGNGYLNTLLTIARVSSEFDTTPLAANYSYAAAQAVNVSPSTNEPICGAISCVGGWYLPNQTEMFLAIDNLCGVTAAGFTPLAEDAYWTSKQSSGSASSAVKVTVSAGCTRRATFEPTSSSLRVRAIRQF